jgi:hypothetical protein
MFRSHGYEAEITHKIIEKYQNSKHNIIQLKLLFYNTYETGSVSQLYTNVNIITTEVYKISYKRNKSIK